QLKQIEMSNPTDPQIQQTVDAIEEKFNARVQEITDRGNQEINEITDEGEQPGAIGAAIGVTVKVDWVTRPVKLDVPKFSSALQKVSFDVPQVTMKTRAFSWDVPATKMETRCIAKKPEMVCKGLKCTVRYKCIYMDFPVAYMKRMEIKTDIPEVVMKKQEFSFNKPVVSFETIEIKTKLPQFTVVNVDAELKEMEAEATRVSKEMEAEIAVAQRELEESLSSGVGDEVENIFEEVRNKLLEDRKAVSGQFEDSISKMKRTIGTLKQNNAAAEVQQMETELAKLVNDYKAALGEIDAALGKLNEDQEAAIKAIKIS
ncbi:MAG TPA: hypothetical protein VF145_01010, partial [Chitinophagaceae bacterium]